MKYFILLFSLLFSLETLAAENAPVNAPTQPTKASSPLPSLSKTKNPDTVLTEKVQGAIRKNSFLKDQAVSAASIDGKITLQGSVKSKAQENEAIKTAKSIKGVKDVESQLTIKNQ